MKVCLDLHDFSIVNNRFDLLMKLKERFPDFKVSVFTVPVDEKVDWGPYLIRGDLLATIRKNLEWIQIIPHGYRHNGQEMRNYDYNEFKRLMETIKETFDFEGLPFEKGFCAPHWKWSNGVVKALDEAGWWGAVDPGQPGIQKTKKVYRYSHDISVPVALDAEVLKLHGHVYGTKNDLGRCLHNLFNIPQTVEWCFITDFLEEG
jgi:hypothetical protein